MSKEIPSYTRLVPEWESSGRHRFSVGDGHTIHGKMCADPHDVAVRSTAQPHRLGESIGQSAMQHSARGKNTRSQNPSKSGVHAVSDSISYTATRGFRPRRRFATEQFT